MKKAKLLGAIALMFALVLGAASCAQDSTPSKTESSKTESSGTDINGATDNNNTTPGGTQDSTPSGSNPSGTAPSGSESSGSDINGATDNNNTNSDGTQDSTPSGSNPSGHKPSGTAPSGTADIKDVIDNPDVDLSGTWKLTDAYLHEYITRPDAEVFIDEEVTTIEEVTKIVTETGDFNILAIALDNNLFTQFSNDFLKTLAEKLEEMEKEFEEMKEEIEKQQAEVYADFDCYLKVNDDYNEIYIYFYESLYEPPSGYDMECRLTFTKQQ